MTNTRITYTVRYYLTSADYVAGSQRSIRDGHYAKHFTTLADAESAVCTLGAYLAEVTAHRCGGRTEYVGGYGRGYHAAEC